MGLRRPCYCDVGLECPHEWGGTCESGQRPITRHEAAQTQNFVYLDGKVGFGDNHWDIARSLAKELGYEGTREIYVSNSIARNVLPNDVDAAVGLVRRGKPQIWLSNVDRNEVYDAIIAAQGP